MCCLESEQVRQRITTNWKEAQVHVLPMMQLSFKVGAAVPFSLEMSNLTGLIGKVIRLGPNINVIAGVQCDIFKLLLLSNCESKTREPCSHYHEPIMEPFLWNKTLYFSRNAHEPFYFSSILRSISISRNCRITWRAFQASMIGWWPSSPPDGPSANRWNRWKTSSLRSVAISLSMVRTNLLFFLYCFSMSTCQQK